MAARVGATTKSKTNRKPTYRQTSMVFSLTSLKTPSFLKVVEKDRLFGSKEKRHTAELQTSLEADFSEAMAVPSGSRGVIPPPSLSEVYLKPEPSLVEAETMYTMDSESFQDLDALCFDPARAGPAPIIDFLNPNEEQNKDTLYTQYSPTGWDNFDPTSPSSGGSSLYNTSVNNKLTADPLYAFDTTHYSAFQAKRPVFENFINIDDINNMPVVIGELEPDLNTNTAMASSPWSTQHYTLDTTDTSTHKTPFIDEEDSLDMKLGEAVAVEPRTVSWPETVISEIIVTETEARKPALKLDIGKAASFSEDPIISTPEVLSYVEQLETHDCGLNTDPWQLNDTFIDSNSPQESISFKDFSPQESISFKDYSSQGSISFKDYSPRESISFKDYSPQETNSFKDYEPITPKSESLIESDLGSPTLKKVLKKRRHDSEDSDESYTPYNDKPTTRKYKRRKPSVPIKEMIMALEEAQPVTKVRRGRPPKRRDSVVSHCSTETSSNVPHESTYREVRDKNNEASKRSRMNRRLKELQMEQLAIELEERNRKLQVRADVLEDLTKKLKGALMSAILKQ